MAVPNASVLKMDCYAPEGQEEDEYSTEEEEDDYDDTYDGRYDGNMAAVGARGGPKKKKAHQAAAANKPTTGSRSAEPDRSRSASKTSRTQPRSAQSGWRRAGEEEDEVSPLDGFFERNEQDGKSGPAKPMKKGGYLKPGHLIYPRFKWDPKLSRMLDRCAIGYVDRFDGLVECPYLSYQTVDASDEGIPFHRIRYFKIDDLIVWDREARLDLLTPGTWESMIHGAAGMPDDSDAETSDGAAKRKIHMLDTAKRHLEQKRGYQVLAAVLSPTSDVQLRKKFWEKDGFLSNKEPNPPGFIPAFHRAKLIELAAEGRTWIKPDLWASQNNAPAAKALAHVHEIFNSNPLLEEVQLISVFGADTLKRVHSFKKKKSSMICVVNRKYEFDAAELFKEKMKGVPTSEDGSSHFIDLVMAEDSAEYCQIDASATLIREAFLSGDPVLERQVCHRLLSESAYQYIRKHRLLEPRPKRNDVQVTIRDLANGILPGIDIGTEIRWEELQDSNTDDSQPKKAKPIGKGISSETFAVHYKGRPVALKVFTFANSARETPRRVLKFMFNEIMALRKLDHKNVIKYVGAGALAEKVFVALELATDGCLAHFLSTKYQLCLSETAQKLPSEGYDQAERWSWKAGIRRWGSSHNRAVLLSVLLGVARGMAHLHERGVLHRDLSIDNVLITEVERTEGAGSAFVAKVSDLGVCQMVSPEECAEREKGYAQLLLVREQRRPHSRDTAMVAHDDPPQESEESVVDESSVEAYSTPIRSTGTYHHLVTVRGNMRLYAPEAVEDAQFYCPASDVFMFAMLMYEVLEGRQAYAECSTHSAIKRKMKGQRPELSPENKTQYPDYVALMQECWAQDPRHRPTFFEVIRRLERLIMTDPAC